MASSTSTEVIRITMFKIPSKEGQQRAIEGYKELARTQSKDGKPYIISLEAGPTSTFDDPRSQGFNFINKTVFKDRGDFDYYDKECAAHQTFRSMMKEEVNVEGFMMVWYEPAVKAGTGR